MRIGRGHRRWGVGHFDGIEERDMEGKYLCPGFIDSHLHLESTLVTPSELIGQAVQCGTTTYIVDPHESANVSGAAGIDYILEQTENVEANVYVMMLPACRLRNLMIMDVNLRPIR